MLRWRRTRRDAAATQLLNLHTNGDAAPAALHAKARGISASLNLQSWQTNWVWVRSADAFDIVVGGPPCQVDTRIGRAKLREIADYPRSYKVDPRANLYLRFLHYVRVTQPW